MLDESSDSSISSVHNFLSCSLIMDAAVAPNWTAHEVHKDALESFLLARPLTTLKTTKFTANRDKTEYHRCRCKCSYRINIYFPRDESDFYQVRETDIPSDHVDVEENPEEIKILQQIDRCLNLPIAVSDERKYSLHMKSKFLWHL